MQGNQQTVVFLEYILEKTLVFQKYLYSSSKSYNITVCLYVISNIYTTFEAQFMKKLSNTEAELKKSAAYEKSVYAYH